MAAPLVIGLSGGIASGKSTVARMFEDLGAVVLDADRIGHEVLDEEETKQKLFEIWGARIFTNGNVDRKLLAAVVFDPDRGEDHLAELERITHPRIRQRILEKLVNLDASQYPAVVLDAPLLFKAGWDSLCKKLVFVEADQDVRLCRAAKRGWSEQEFREREKRQTPLSVKRERSTDVVDNAAGLANTFAQVCRIWKNWGLQIPLNAERCFE